MPRNGSVLNPLQSVPGFSFHRDIQEVHRTAAAIPYGQIGMQDLCAVHLQEEVFKPPSKVGGTFPHTVRQFLKRNDMPELIDFHPVCLRRADPYTDTPILQHLPRQISGGEAQRVAIARCLLFQPRLLILDEATSMLDVSTQANVIALVRRVTARHGGSILLISHDRALVDKLCDQIYVFDKKTLKKEKET